MVKLYGAGQNGLVISMGIFNFLGMWNQYILPLVLLTNRKKVVLSQGLVFLQHQQRIQIDWSGLFAAVVIIMLPTMIVYIIFQNQIQRGLTVGALKGEWVFKDLGWRKDNQP